MANDNTQNNKGSTIELLARNEIEKFSILS